MMPLSLGVALALVLAQIAPAAADPGGQPGAAGAPGAPVGASDEAGASRLAAQLGRPVVVESMTTDRNRFVAEPDGTLRAELHADPVRVRKAGGWVDIDRSLVADGAGRLVAAAAEAAVTFSMGGDGPLAAYVSSEGESVEFGWGASLPEPVVAGGSATYRDVRRGADLVVEAGNEGFESSLVLRERPARGPVEVAFPVYGSGVSIVAAEAGGGFEVRGADGGVLLYVPKPLMWDSGVDAASGSARLGPLAARVEGEAGRQSLVLSADESFLQDPATVYPVTIDPYWVKGQFLHTYIDSAYPNESYVGNDWDPMGLHVGTFNGGGSVNRAMYRFDAPELMGRTIQQAQFHTATWYSWSCNYTPIHVYHVEDWGWGTTWSNQPGGSGPWAGQDAAACPAGPVIFDITQLIQVLVGQGRSTYGLELRAGNEGDNFGWKKVNPDPLVAVTYNSVPAVPDALGAPLWSSPCHSVSDAGNPKYNNASGDLLMTAYQSDPDGDNVATAFEIYGPSTYMGAWWAPWQASGTHTGAVIPAGSLPDSQYWYWAISTDGQAWSQWSGQCFFEVDNTPPNQPGVSSSHFTSTDIFNPAGTAGDIGPVTLSAGGSGDVRKYFYSTAGPLPVDLPLSAGCGQTVGTVTVACPAGYGGDATVSVRLGAPFLNNASAYLSSLWVQTWDGVNVSPATQHQFAIGYSQYDHAYTFDTVVAAVPTVVADDYVGVSGAWDMTLHGASSLAPGHSSDGLSLSGSAADYASAPSDIPMGAGSSFAVAAWLNPAAAPAGLQAAVSREGPNGSSFVLGVRDGAWAMCVGGGAAQICATSSTSAALGTWTFVAGIYDAVTGTVELVVGDPLYDPPATEPAYWAQPAPAPEASTGPLLVGRGSVSGAASYMFAGSVDSVFTWPGLPSVSDLRFGFDFA